MFRLIKKYDSLSKRIVLLAFTTICLCMLLVGSFIVWNFHKSQKRMLDSYLSAYVDTLISVTVLDDSGNIVVSDNVSLFDNMPFYWQILLGEKVLNKSNFSGYTDNMIIVKKDYIFPGNQKVTYEFGVQKEIADAYIKSEWYKFIGSVAIVFIVIAFSFIAILAILQIVAIIKPLNRIRNEIVDIHEGGKTKIEGSFPKEIEVLAKEINKLIGYNISIIERYRTFAANLSHALKTPLTVINNETQKSSGKLAKIVKERTSDMLELIDRNLTRANVVGVNNTLTSNVDLLLIIEKTAKSFGKLYNKEVKIINDSDESIFQGNESDLYEILGNLIENACKYSKTSLKVTVANIKACIVITIEDDGSGIPENQINNVLNHGTRLDKNKPGHGIGLAVANDIITLYDGNLKFGKSDDLGGLKVVITLPLPI